MRDMSQKDWKFSWFLKSYWELGKRSKVGFRGEVVRDQGKLYHCPRPKANRVPFYAVPNVSWEA